MEGLNSTTTTAQALEWVPILAPLIAVPLTMIVFYLRTIREHQLTRERDFQRRLDGLERHAFRVQARFQDIERSYALKEEWVRESIRMRNQIERLLEKVACLDAVGVAPRLGGCGGGGRPNGAAPRVTESPEGTPASLTVAIPVLPPEAPGPRPESASAESEEEFHGRSA